MTTLEFAVILAFFGAFTLAIVFWFIWRQERQPYIHLWSLSWLAYGLRFCFQLLYIHSGSTLAVLFTQLFGLLNVYLLALGTLQFSRRTMARSIHFLFLSVAIYVVTTGLLDWDQFLVSIPVFTLGGLTYIWTGALLLRSTEMHGFGSSLSGWAFILWGIHKLDYPLLRPVAWFAPWGYAFGWALAVMVALGILMAYYEMNRKNLSTRTDQVRLLSAQSQELAFRYRLMPKPGFEYVSPAATAIVGYTPEEHYADPELGQKIVYPEDAHLLQNLLEFRQRTMVSLRWIRKDGKVIWTEQLLTPIRDDEDQLIALEGIARDITELKQTQIELQQRNRELEAITENIAQNLSTPIRHIKSFAQLLPETDSDPEHLRTYSERILKASKRIAVTARALRWVSESSRHELVPGRLNLSQLARECLLDLKENSVFWKQPRISIDEDIWLRGDADLMRIAMHALLSNALKFSCTGEQHIQIKFLTEKGWHGVAIRDNGVGFDMADVDRIFLPAQRLHNNQFEDGAGIGLSVVKRIIDRHNGRIWAEGTPGEGATFCFLLPDQAA